MSVQEICAKQFDSIPNWKFWRRNEKEFWFGGILASYAAITGNKKLNDLAEAIFDKYYPHSKKWVAKAEATTKGKDNA